MSIDAALALVILPADCGMTLLVSELSLQLAPKERPLNRAAPFRFAFLSAFSVPRSKHPRPSDARSPSQNPLRASQEVRTPAPRQAVVPFRRFYPVAEGVGRDGTPVGQACTADSGQTKRNGAKHHVQQSHPHRPPRTERRSQNRSEQQRVRHPQHRNPGELEER
jgi:hypothetical protein